MKKYKFLFVKKKFPKLLSRHNMQPNTLQDVNTKVKFMLSISENNWKVGSVSEKFHSGSTTLLFSVWAKCCRIALIFMYVDQLPFFILLTCAFYVVPISFCVLFVHCLIIDCKFAHFCPSKEVLISHHHCFACSVIIFTADTNENFWMWSVTESHILIVICIDFSNLPHSKF